MCTGGGPSKQRGRCLPQQRNLCCCCQATASARENARSVCRPGGPAAARPDLAPCPGLSQVILRWEYCAARPGTARSVDQRPPLRLGHAERAASRTALHCGSPISECSQRGREFRPHPPGLQRSGPVGMPRPAGPAFSQCVARARPCRRVMLSMHPLDLPSPGTRAFACPAGPGRDPGPPGLRASRSARSPGLLWFRFGQLAPPPSAGTCPADGSRGCWRARAAGRPGAQI